MKRRSKLGRLFVLSLGVASIRLSEVEVFVALLIGADCDIALGPYERKQFVTVLKNAGTI